MAASSVPSSGRRLFGTAAMTVSSTTEAKPTGRDPSTMLAEAAGIDTLRHAVFAGTTGAAYDYLRRR